MSKTEREMWTPEMDDALVDAFLHQQTSGNKVGGTFTSKAYDSIIKELQEKFERPFDKKKVKSRWKSLKNRFAKCYDLFKNGLSGFAWNPTTKRWCAEREVWQKLIETRPEAEEWMKKPIANYDKMMIMCGEDRATGQNSETGEDIRNNKRPRTGEFESNDETNEITSESMQGAGNDQDVTSPEIQIVRGQEVKDKRSRRSKDENEVEGIKMALQDIAQAMREGNSIYKELKQKLPISPPEIWKLLEELKIDDRHLMKIAYMHLLENPDKITAILGCPKDIQKKLLLDYVFGPGGPSRSSTVDLQVLKIEEYMVFT